MHKPLQTQIRLLVVVGVLGAVAVGFGAPEATASPAGEPRADEKATKDDYALDTSGSATKLKVGADGSFALTITPKNGKKVHPEAPLEVTFEDVKGIKPKKKKLGRTDIVAKASATPELRTSVSALAVGSATLVANVSFFLCTDAWCQRMSDRVSVAYTVE